MIDARGTIRRAIAAAVVCALLVRTPSLAAMTGNAMPTAERTSIDRIASGARAAQNVAGISVTIARAGTIVYARGFGTRSKNDAGPVDAATIFPIGSITKQFTAAVIALLVRDGKIGYDATLATYLPDAPHAREITIRQLLQQTSGLANYSSQPQFLRTISLSTTVTPRDLIATIANEPLDFVPGTQFEYSNTNYVMLGAVIEAVTGDSYASVIDARIARPLGLRTLTFGPPSGTANVVRSPWTPQATSAAGALYASPADLVRWDRAFFAGDLVPAETVREMTTPPTLAKATLPYAFGWVADTLDGRVQIWHNGGVLGANTRNCWFPVERLAVVVFGNAIDFDPGPVVRATMRVIAPPSIAAIAAALRPAAGEDLAITAKARAEYAAWASGTIERAHYDATMRAALDDATIAKVSRYLAIAGEPSAFVFEGRRTTGATETHRYRVETPQAPIAMAIAFDPDGTIAGIRFTPAP